MIDGIGFTWIAFSWQQDQMNREITEYVILISGGGTGRNVTVGGAQMSTNVTELESGTEYRLRVVAVAMDGQTSPPSNVLIATTTLPGTIIHANHTYFNASLCPTATYLQLQFLLLRKILW